MDLFVLVSNRLGTPRTLFQMYLEYILDRLVGLVEFGIARLDTNYKKVPLILLGPRHDQECI